jgi:PKD repeat protein
MQKIIPILLILFFISFVSAAQENKCSSTEIMKAHFKAHPELKAAFDAQQAQINAQLNSGLGAKTAATPNYTIPMVFHVLHQNGYENITDAQILDAVNVLNTDFSKKNADTANTLPVFRSIADSTSIRFALARKDPNGNCTSGIVRYFDTDADWNDNSSTLYSQGWDPTQYLNIYVVKTITMSSGFSAAGYTFLPGSWPIGSSPDAIVILHSYIGTIGTSSQSHSHVLTHEVGHWFDLNHVFGWNSCGVDCNNDDDVSDTPQTPGYLTCPSSYSICTPGVPENYQNFMDYSYCETMFTHGQALRMDAAAHSNISGRSNLWTPTNLSITGITPVSPCAPAALFKSNRQVVCAGQSINYTDLSNISTPTGWSWVFEGGTPNVSSVQNPTVTYNSPGTYSVQLISSNSVGNSTPEIKTSYVTVLSTPIAATLTEGFETSTLPNSVWMVANTSVSNTNWQQTNTAFASGSKSAFVSQNATPSSTVELYSPTYDFTSMPNLALTFKWAAAERDQTTPSNDVFSLFFSTNCGLSWIPRLSKNIRTTTAGVSGLVNGNFIPTPAQFHQEAISLASFSAYNNILFKFRYVTESGSSNNFYLDDINLTSTTDIAQQSDVLFNLSVFPNPASETISVAFDLLENKKVEITLNDVLGKTIQSVSPQSLQQGNHTLTMSVNDLSKGIYFMTININNLITTKKIIVD